MASRVIGFVVFGRVWFVVYLTAFPDYQLAVFFLSKLFLTMISLGESLTNIPFLRGEAFSHRTEKYMILVTSNFWRYLNGIVVTMNQVLSLTVRICISISATSFLAAELFTMIISIKSFIVFSNSVSMKRVCTKYVPGLSEKLFNGPVTVFVCSPYYLF